MSCLRCGKCCIDAFMNLWDITKDNEKDLLDKAQWLSHHRCDPIRIKQGKKECIGLSIPLTCKHLVYRKEGYTCKIYEDRPNVCKKYTCGR